MGHRTSFPALALSLAAALAPARARPAHPLLTEDAGTVGRGVRELELAGGLLRDRGAADGVAVREEAAEAGATFTVGLADDLDVAVAAGFHWRRVQQGAATVSDGGGPRDLGVALAWRLLETKGLALLVKPGLTLSVSDPGRGLGIGRAGAYLLVAATASLGPLALDLNAGGERRSFSSAEERAASRPDLLRLSVSARARVLPGVTVVAEAGAATPPERSARTWPAFALAGAIASVAKGLDLDLGLRTALNAPEANLAVLVGATRRW